METPWSKLRCNCFRLCLCYGSSQPQPQSSALQVQSQHQGPGPGGQQLPPSHVAQAQQVPQSSSLALQVSTSSPSAAGPFDANNISELKVVLDYLDQALDGNGQQQQNVQVAIPEVVKNNLTHATNALEQIRKHFMEKKDEQGLVGDIAGESGKVLRDVFSGVGNLHWTLAGLLLIASVTERLDQMSSNTMECFNILTDLRKLGGHLVSIFQGLPERDSTIQEATSLIFEGVVLCLNHFESTGISGSLKRFGFVNVQKSNLSTLRVRINSLYPNLVLTILDRQISKPLQPFSCKAPEDTVGLEEKVQEVLKLLRVVEGKVESGVQAILLVGMGGVGKTTLGKAVCSRLPFANHQFAQIEVGEEPAKETIRNCQSNILERLSGKKQNIGSFDEGQGKLKEYFASLNTPVLLFLDNVFHENHLENLMPSKLTLPDRSRIIITSRDKNFTGAFSEIDIDFQVYRVYPLEKSLAKALFKQHHGEYPPERQDQVDSILQSCGGLPLALEVIGKRLKRKKDDGSAWRSAVEDFQKRLHTTGHKEDRLISSLKLSYDDLSTQAQVAFLDVSCLLKNFPWDFVQTVYGSFIEDLEDLSLVRKDKSLDTGYFRCLKDSVSSVEVSWYRYGGFQHIVQHWLCGSAFKVGVHDVLVTFGQNLSKSNGATRVQGRTGVMLPSPLQPSDQGECESVQGIVVKRCAEPLLAERLDATCKSLRILVLEKVQVKGICSEVPSRLQICSTKDVFPFSDPSPLNELLVLEISGPQVDLDFKSVQFPRKLKVLRLSKLAKLRCFHKDTFGRCSTSLHTFEVFKCPALKELPPSFCHLRALRMLILQGNKVLRSIPKDFDRLVSLQTTMIWSSQCSSKEEFWALLPYNLSPLILLENVALDCAKTQQLPAGLGNLRALKRLNILGCESITMLPNDLCNLKCLIEMRLGGCQGLCELPHDFGNLTVLCHLELQGCICLAQLPNSFSQLTSLQRLALTGCQSLNKLPEGFGKLVSLSWFKLDGCEGLHQLSDDFGELKSLEELKLTGCRLLTKLPKGFGKLVTLSNLTLRECHSLCELPYGFGELRSLKTL